MRESSNSVDSKSFKPAMNIGTLLEPRNGVQKLNKTGIEWYKETVVQVSNMAHAPLWFFFNRSRFESNIKM